MHPQAQNLRYSRNDSLAAPLRQLVLRIFPRRRGGTCRLSVGRAGVATAFLASIMIVPQSAQAWHDRASPDDLVQMNTDYGAVRGRMEAIIRPLRDELTKARQAQLLGTEDTHVDMASFWQVNFPK